LRKPFGFCIKCIILCKIKYVFLSQVFQTSSFFFSFFNRLPKKRKMKQKEKKTGLGLLLATSGALSSVR